MLIIKNLLVVIILSQLVGGCAEKVKQTEKIIYQPLPWQNLSTWQTFDITGVTTNLKTTCNRFAKKPSAKYTHKNKLFGTYANWKNVCSNIPKKSQITKYWLESNFKLYRVTSPEANTKHTSLKHTGSLNQASLFTGYYSPVVEGNLKKTKEYNIPLYSYPKDIFTADLGAFYPELKGKKITARISGNKIKPYYIRKEIGANNKNQQVAIWLKSPIDSFFMHIQGSGFAKLPNGNLQHISYAGNNGHKYTAIGRTLIKAGEINKADISMESIKHWLQNNPKKQAKIFNSNKRYIFFGLDNKQTQGSFQTNLKDKQSIAVDPKYIPLGYPLLVSTTITYDNSNFNQLVMAHDTGGAINGAVRGDIYFGVGTKAAQLAGKQNSTGELYILVPN